MKRREVLYLIGEDDVVLYSEVSTSASELPDRRARWEAIWAHRFQLVEIVHSHPSGPLQFSACDETTMRALDQALGVSIQYAILAYDEDTQLKLLRRQGADTWTSLRLPEWAYSMHDESGMEPPLASAWKG